MGLFLAQTGLRGQGKPATYQPCYGGKNPLRGGEDCPRQFCNNPSTKEGIGKVSLGVSVKNRAYFLMLAATTLLSAPAMAAPVFMLQFGSFETREEADKRLNELKSQHAGVIGSMQSGIREVTLPPDNLTVYRTQAGPVDTRATAQSICGQLASNGDECYVVETAMAPGFAAPTQIAQTTAPTEQAVAAVTPAPMALAAAPNPSSMSTPALLAAAAGSTTAPQAVPPVAMTPVPLRDPSNAAAINRVTATPAVIPSPTPAPMAVATAAPTISPSMQKAMDNAAAEQVELNSKVAGAPTPAGAKEEGTFWSRMNPFSSSDEPKAPAPVLAKPVTVETPAIQAPVVEAPKMVTPSPVLAAPEVLSPLPQDAPRMAMAAPAPAPSPMLPPPPAPTVGKGAVSIAGSTAASLRAPAPVIAPEPLGTLQSPQTPPPIVIGDNNGNVRVGEAQRVPLSQATVPQTLPAPPAFGAAIPAPVPALSPSSNLGQKTLWAHVGQFSDAQAALAFWDQYRRSHPDFPVVRVRVTSPLQSLNHGNDKVSLRVGPFAKEASIKTLCTTISQQQTQTKGERLICGSIVDMGIASRVGGARSGFLPGSRYNR